MGKAFLFAPTAILVMTQMSLSSPQASSTGSNIDFDPEYLGSGAIRVQVRGLLTQDGGRSVLSM